MKENQEEIDPTAIEVNLINELVGENILIIIHQNGVSIMMDDMIEERTDEQMAMFSRLYVASRPSLVLRFVLALEVYFVLLEAKIEQQLDRWFKKDE
jgi:hypothetical protein